jgi:hypothetical protein
MKESITLVAAIAVICSPAQAQERSAIQGGASSPADQGTTAVAPPTSATAATTTTTSPSVQAAVDLYKERASEGAAPTLIIKNGEAKLMEEPAVTSYPGELMAYAPPALIAGGGGLPTLMTEKAKALGEQIKVLKELNAALEKELADCKAKP